MNRIAKFFHRLFALPDPDTERQIIELACAKLLDEAVVLLREHLGEAFSSDLIRVSYCDAECLCPWCIGIGTEVGKCFGFGGASPDAALEFFRESLPVMAQAVREKLS